MQRCVSAMWLVCLATWVGCGQGLEKFPLAEVTGTVVCEGRPVAKAMVFFEPVRSGDKAEVGKQGFALTDEDGKFVVSTYGDEDGAVVGRHLVRVGKTEASQPCPCALNADNVLQEVEVKSGDPQSFELVLKKKSARNRDQIIEDDDDE